MSGNDWAGLMILAMTLTYLVIMCRHDERAEVRATELPAPSGGTWHRDSSNGPLIGR